MQRAGRREAFDGRHRATVSLNGQAGARADRDAVEQHRAGAALARVATDLGAGHTAEVADEVDEKQARFDVAVVATSVDDDAHRNLHVEHLRSWRGSRIISETPLPASKGSAAGVESDEEAGKARIASDGLEVGQPALEGSEHHVAFLDSLFAEAKGAFVIAQNPRAQRQAERRHVVV